MLTTGKKLLFLKERPIFYIQGKLASWSSVIESSFEVW